MANIDNMTVRDNNGTAEVQVGGDVGILDSNLKGDVTGKSENPGAVQVEDGKITHHGPQKISTYRDHTGADVMSTVQKVGFF